MNFFEQELRKLFGDGQVIDAPTYSGRACFGTLGSNLRVRAQFVTTGIADHYDALKITVFNRTGGPVDDMVLELKDLLGMKPVPKNPNLRDGVAPHIWVYQGKPEWYAYRPTAADYQVIRQAVGRYLDVFRDRSRERIQKHTQGGPRLVYICAPFRDDSVQDIAADITFARKKAQEVFRNGDIPICPRLMFLSITDLGDPEQAQEAREISLRLLESCQQVNVYGDELTEAMVAELGRVAELGMPVTSERPSIPAKKRSPQKRRTVR